jgi:LPS O-antigen subunit length determinant protein (WzzB/FepE family)
LKLKKLKIMPNNLPIYFTKLKDSYISIIATSLIFAFLGMLHALNSPPQYLVTVALDQKKDAQGSMGSSSLVSLALGGSQSGSKFYYEIKEVMYSMEVTKKFDENYDGLSDYFGHLYDESQQVYKPLWNLSTILKKVKFSLLGVPYQPIPNLYFLNQVVKGEVNIRYDDFAELIYISSYTSSPNITSKLINGLISETDASMKSAEKFEIEERIKFLIQELNQITTIEQREALSEILENQLLKKSLISTNALYKIMIVRGVEVSEYPVKPNLFFLVSLFFLLGLMASIGFHTARVISKDFV